MKKKISRISFFMSFLPSVVLYIGSLYMAKIGVNVGLFGTNSIVYGFVAFRYLMFFGIIALILENPIVPTFIVVYQVSYLILRKNENKENMLISMSIVAMIITLCFTGIIIRGLKSGIKETKRLTREKNENNNIQEGINNNKIVMRDGAVYKLC